MDFAKNKLKLLNIIITLPKVYKNQYQNLIKFAIRF